MIQGYSLQHISIEQSVSLAHHRTSRTGHSTSDGQGPAHSQQIGEIPSTAYGRTEHRTVLLPLELVDWLMTVMGGTCATAH